MRKKTVTVLAACAMTVFAGSVFGVTVNMTVFDGGNKNLDGNVGETTAPNPSFVIGTPGAINQTPLWHVSKFKLDTILPPSVLANPGLIVAAELSLPDMDQLRNGTPGIHTFSLDHFATDDNLTVSPADGGFGVPLLPAISSWRPFGGGRHPLVPNVARVALQDVTASVINDVAAGRALSSWRWGIGPNDALLSTPAAGGDNYTFPDSDGVGTGFDFSPNMMRLTIEYVPEPASIGLLAVGLAGMLRRRH